MSHDGAVGKADGVVLSRVGEAAYIRFFSAKANSLSLKLLEQLNSELLFVAKDPLIKIVVLESEGLGAFCGGASFDEMKQINDFEQAKKFFMGFGNVILAMVRCPVPVIVVAQGKAVGGALGIIAASDYAIASKAAEVRLSELSLGIGPYVISAPLIRRIGEAKFSELTLGLQWRDATWSAQAGLFSELAPDAAAARDQAINRAEVLCGISREALVSVKQMLSSSTQGWEKTLDKLAESSAKLLIAQKH